MNSGNKMSKKTIIFLSTAFLFLILIIAFTTKKDKSIEDAKVTNTTVIEKTAGERATARWNALINRNWEKAYSYQSPNYRKTYTLEAFTNNFGRAVEWKKVKLLSEKAVSDSVVDVEIEIISLFKDVGVEMMLPGQFFERWQKIDGTWWYFKKK